MEDVASLALFTSTILPRCRRTRPRRRREWRVTSHAEQFDDKDSGGGGIDRNRRPGDCGEARRTRRMAGGRGDAVRRDRPRPRRGDRGRLARRGRGPPPPRGGPRGDPPLLRGLRAAGWLPAGGRPEPRSAGQRGRGTRGGRRTAAARDARHRGEVLWRPSRTIGGARRGDRATAPRPELLLRPGRLS